MAHMTLEELAAAWGLQFASVVARITYSIVESNLFPFTLVRRGAANATAT